MTRTGRLDDFQRRHPVVGFPLAVVYKFFDDQGGYLAMTLTHNAFVAIFPLMLISSSILGFLLQGNEALKETLLRSALNEFPIIGTQLSTQAGLQGSTSAVIVGGLAATYGVIGLGQAFQNAVNHAWAVARNSRRNPFLSRVWSIGLLGLGGLIVLTLAGLASLPTVLPAAIAGWSPGWVASLGSIAATIAGLTLLIAWSGPRSLTFRDALPGAVLIALGWNLLQRVGGIYVEQVLARASDVNAVFALSLGLIGFLYIAANTVVLGLEVNVVVSEHLYPRALLTPFTDRVELTDADRRAYTSYAQAQRHKGFEHVTVTFAEPTRDADPT